MGVTVFGWLWFANSFNIFWHAYVFICVIAFFVAVLSPAKIYQSQYRFLLVGIYLTSITATLLIMYEDVTLINDPDFGALIIRAIHIVIFVALIKETKIRQLPNKRASTAGA